MRATVITLAVLLSLFLGVSASTPDGGLQSPFSLGTGARELALGGAALPTVDAAMAPYWNASRLASAEHYTLGAFHCRLFDSDVAYQYLGVVVPTLDFGGFGFGIFRLGIGGIEERDADNILLGEINDNRLGFYLAYGRQLSGNDVGLTLSMESHSLGDYSATSTPGLTLSLGRRMHPNFANFSEVRLVVVGRNLMAPSTELADASIAQPAAAELGLTATMLPNRLWDQAVNLSMSLTKVESVNAELAMGLEYNIQDLLFVRGGVRDSRLSFGIGISYSPVDFDYALVDRDLGNLHMFSITTAFGRSVSERRALRAEKREIQFAQMMEERMQQQNRNTVAELRSRGEQLLAGEELTEAAQCFDRALFLARASGEDTADIASLAESARYRLDMLLRETNYGKHLDSARAAFGTGQYLEARYFATRALQFAEDSSEASKLIKRIDYAVEQVEGREEMIRAQLWSVDSLVSYGEIDRALQLLESLNQIAPGDKSVRQATRKVLFEHECRKATASYERADFATALIHLDSALTLLPGHQWCTEMRQRIQTETTEIHVEREKILGPAPSKMTDAVLEEVGRRYETGQKLFSNGDLVAAVGEWEAVLALAPKYMSVREYLVRAYKFIGVEHYGQNMLAEAVAYWKKAIRLDSDNTEILDYIQRAENEIRKLKELTYETGQ
ncbi:MAG: hypothetical protein JSV52_15380 [Candidatus Zixiibacteriota bacterium]|nr:MAG: hypothetical protein JSV52_15380 [candidate division Zixibacteria bacterium]